MTPSSKSGREAICNRGHLFIISAPSGAGKTTLCKAALAQFKDMIYSVSYTTRRLRRGEEDGIDYHFITEDDFKKGIEDGKWAEWAEVYGNFYGTSAMFLDSGLASGKDILLDIDVQGTLQIIKRYPNSVTIFIMPPSLDTLRIRLESRSTDSKQDITRRLVDAEKEMARRNFYRYIIVNNQLAASVAKLMSIIEKYRSGG